jgi:two-component system, cell cycle sensor histidine kinase and response regulator CckA
VVHPASRGFRLALRGAGRSRWLRWRPGRAARRSREFELATRLAALVESSADSIVSATLDGVVTSWNAVAERMYGWAAEEIIGQSTSVLIPSALAAELLPVFQRLRQGEILEPFETMVLRKNGSIIEMRLSDSPIPDTRGAATGISAITRDVPGRNRAEAERRALEDRLRQAERLESLGQPAGGTARDFNNVLGVIMNFAAFVAADRRPARGGRRRRADPGHRAIRRLAHPAAAHLQPPREAAASGAGPRRHRGRHRQPALARHRRAHPAAY